MERFKNRNVLVTGASRGIGKAISLAFAREGAHVVLSSRKLEALSALADEIRASAPDAGSHVERFELDGQEVTIGVQRAH